MIQNKKPIKKQPATTPEKASTAVLDSLGTATPVSASADRLTPNPALNVNVNILVDHAGSVIGEFDGKGGRFPIGQLRPNIKFCGRSEMDREKRKVTKAADPLERFSVAGEIIKLPPGDFQKRRRLFYHESADIIAATFPNLYKLVSPKGK